MGTEGEFVEIPEMYDNSEKKGNYKILFPKDGYVLALGEPINLCGMCQKSPATCENPLPRQVRVSHTTTTKTKPIIETPYFKIVDGIEEGLLSENDITGNALMCNWFLPKELG